MGQKQSRDKLMYHYVLNKDVGGIQFLSKQGAGLEWKDKEGKTPLMVAAKESDLYDVAKTLIEMGANVNAFCKGRKGGTPLHFAARQGIDNTVALLLSHGGPKGILRVTNADNNKLEFSCVNITANAFVENREHHTPLDVARNNGHNLVVREIESRVCYFAGHIRENFGPGLSDVAVAARSQSSTSAIIWVVVVPRSPHNPPKPPILELVIYSTPEDAAPRKIVSLRRSKMKAPRFDQPSPTLTIFDKQTKTRYKFSSVTFNNKQQLRRLYNACKGISQAAPSAVQMMASETTNSPLHPTSQINSPAWRTPGISSPPMSPNNNVWVHESPRRADQYSNANSGATQIQLNPAAVSSPTVSVPLKNNTCSNSNNNNNNNNNNSTNIIDVDEGSTSLTSVGADTTIQPAGCDSALCVVCWETRVEAACVPCGHVSTCMSCLKKIKDNKEACPVCRGEINQIVKLSWYLKFSG